ncbi:nuclear transport factor 2 family protein [Streptomyces werraensis]|uniref:nuclear transport factor 2 family protein n=1 Tax=Streptomyces werraensis TaxID=68284 RepID=UPI0037FDF3D1
MQLLGLVRGPHVQRPVEGAERRGGDVLALLDGVFVSWSLDEYRGLFPGRPAADEAAGRRRIDGVDVHGSVATAPMTLRHGAGAFTDVFLPARTARAGGSPTRCTGTPDPKVSYSFFA